MTDKDIIAYFIDIGTYKPNLPEEKELPKSRVQSDLEMWTEAVKKFSVAAKRLSETTIGLTLQTCEYVRCIGGTACKVGDVLKLRKRGSFTAFTKTGHVIVTAKNFVPATEKEYRDHNEKTS